MNRNIVKKHILAANLKVRQENREKSALDRLADDNGIAVALVDADSREIFSANNNSICRQLNPEGGFATHCKAFCGMAFDEVKEVGSATSFTCHAGLECRVVPVSAEGRPLVAIVGRTFLNAENYRRATTRAISGDWKDHSPAEFFENVLLTGSSAVLDKAAAAVEKLLPRAVQKQAERSDTVRALRDVSISSEERAAEQPKQSIEKPVTRPSPVLSNIVAKFNREVGLPDVSPADRPIQENDGENKKVEPAVTDVPAVAEPGMISGETAVDGPEIRSAEARAWRSFFGSILKMDYPSAVDSILEFISLQYGLTALIWLERNDRRLVNTSAFGEMKNRKLRLGIAADDARLLEAAQNDVPLELAERPKQGAPSTDRVMNLFPIGVGGEISAGIAVFEKIAEEKTKRYLSRICQSIAPQLEILRLRNAVASGESLTKAVRRFNESLKMIDADDLWVKITQNAAEMLKAERASLMVLDERTKTLEIKALIGGVGAPGKDEIVGERVARLVFEKNKPIIVPDVAKTGLPPAAAARNYKTPSFLSCPLSIGGRTIGVMSFADKASGQPFDRASLSLLQAIAPQIAITIDRASLKEKAGEYEQLSVTDTLTGLLNRRYIDARLAEEVKRSNRHGFPMSFMMIDVDHFKSYNDQFGHPAGDDALKTVGHVIRDTLRGADVAARYGGEEFAVLLPQTSGEEAAAIAERIRHNIAETLFPHRRVTTSIGIASCSAELCSVIDIVAAADKALYEAKHQGRNRVLAFDDVPNS